ncbi:MAG: hypothetical protein GC162_09295 [Planctomycetes bacterium]|nr:hypothetical protein [Planctomycetota bacterium]
MNNHKHNMLLVTLLSLVLGGWTGVLHAADEAPAAEKPAAEAPAAEKPADAAAPVQDLATVVTFVNGLVQVRQAEDQPWVKAEVGMKLAAGAEFRTGPRSQVQFKVGDTQIVSLDRLGTIKVIDAIKQGGKVETDLGLKYGRSELKVDAGGGLEHESKIYAPGTTLAVRGSAGAMDTNAWGTVVYCTEHLATATVKDSKGKVVQVKLPEKVLATDKNGDSTDAIRSTDTFNPQQGGSTETENTLYAQYPTGTFTGAGGGVDTNGLTGAGNTSMMQDMVADNSGGGLINIGGTGQIRGQLIWNNTADLDLHLILPSEDEVSFSNTMVTFNGGGAIAKLDHDNTGGVIDAAPDYRVENIAVNGTSVPGGTYTFFVHNFSSHGNATTPFTLILSGDNGHTSVTKTGTLTSGQFSSNFNVVVPGGG